MVERILIIRNGDDAYSSAGISPSYGGGTYLTGAVGKVIGIGLAVELSLPEAGEGPSVSYAPIEQRFEQEEVGFKPRERELDFDDPTNPIGYESDLDVAVFYPGGWLQMDDDEVAEDTGKQLRMAA